MLQLICHHTYDTWGGLPVDRSTYGLSNGSNLGAGFAPDGAAPGSGALAFGNGQLVSVPTSEAWRELGALSVEVVANPRALGFALERRFLVVGDGSFSLAHRFPEGLEGVVMGPGGGPAAVVTSSSDDAPDGHSHMVPDGRWSTLGFTYDGFSRMEVSIDGVVVGRKSVRLSIQPVGAGGVSIGARPDGGEALRGQIDSVRVWRRDPDAVKRQFLCRPHDQALADCWTAAFTALGAAFERHPVQMRALARAVQTVMDDHLQTVAGVGPEALAQLREILDRYTYLWCNGALDTDDMESTFRDLVVWWRGHTRTEPGGDKLEGIAEGLHEQIGGSIDLTCDPALPGFFERIANALRS